MAVIGDVFRVEVHGVLAGQSADNVYHYLCDTGSATASQFLTAFKTQIIENVMFMQSVSYQLSTIKVKNLQNPSDNAVEAYVGENGSRGGDCNPSFLAYGFEFIPYISGVNDGGKRIAGCAETDVANSLPSAFAVSQLGTIAFVLGSYVGAGASGDFAPVIARYVEDADGHQIFQAAFGISAVAFKRVTSQVSRLIGRGS